MTEATALPAVREPLWGHPLQIWDTGRTIRVPQKVFPLLAALGLLIGRKAIVSPAIFIFFRDAIDDPNVHWLRQVLGPDLSGPAWCLCNCPECRRLQSDIDHTSLPGRNPLDEDVAEQIVRQVVARRVR
jgi:hypothetical protein